MTTQPTTEKWKDTLMALGLKHIRLGSLDAIKIGTYSGELEELVGHLLAAARESSYNDGAIAGYDKGYQRGAEEMLEKNITDIEKYFRGLVVIPFPEITKHVLIEFVRSEIEK